MQGNIWTDRFWLVKIALNYQKCNRSLVIFSRKKKVYNLNLLSWNRSSLPLLLFLLLQLFRDFDHKNIITICIRVNISTQRFVSPIAKSASAFPLCATLGLHLSGATTVFTSTTTKVFASWTTVLLLFTLLDLLYTASRMALCLWVAFQIPLHYQVLVF